MFPLAPSQTAETPWRRDERVTRGRSICIEVNANVVQAFEGETLIAALAAAGFITLRHSPTAGTPRGAFCLMGVCQECLVHVDGVPVTACLDPVREGMVVVLDKLARERRAADGANL